ncbi:MAG: hypothetical protein LC772_08610 [Chloroflexi bacterium]|nr:hypothetical protein [Chloroflexota bacterium]
MLAREMKTDEWGTTMAALARTAGRHGFKAEGKRVTLKGLLEQKLPLIALVAPGHFVIVERASDQEVTYWNPVGPTDGVTQTVPVSDWQRMWDGVVLTL